MTSTRKIIDVEYHSCVPLHVECSLGGRALGSGTAFVVTHEDRNYLITNWHVVTGRDPATGDPISNDGAADPDTIHVWFHRKGKLGTWRRKDEPLRDSASGRPKWLEHPRGREIDVVALPVGSHHDIVTYALDRSLAAADVAVTPAEPVSIIGFPLGLTAGGKFPIWKTGHIASDTGLDYDGKPIFLIDASTRGGMSGSPVIAKRMGSVPTLAGGTSIVGQRVRFLGIYSGLIHPESDVGTVWKPEVLDAILP